MFEAFKAGCERYGLSTEAQIAHLVRAADLLGEGFDREPGNEWVREVLRDPDLSPDQRVAMLVAFAELLAEESEGGV